jgi:N utilization substance protein B
VLWRHDFRSATRLAIVQVLYQIEISGQPCGAVIAQFLTHQEGAIGVDEEAYDIDDELFAHIVAKVDQDHGSLDDHIATVLSREWSMDRLGATMRALLRAACYELVARSDVPARVVIKEYVDIARGFHGLEETGFVNAALDRLARALRTQEMTSDRSEKDSEVNAAIGQ